jgi:tripartite-type tricarboxylate transporter receptor subunit TctC
MPTLLESGVNVELGWISGIYAPAGTPASIVTRLNREVGRIMQTPSTKKELEAMAALSLPHMTPEEFAGHQQRARDKFGAIVRQAGIKAN